MHVRLKRIQAVEFVEAKEKPTWHSAFGGPGNGIAAAGFHGRTDNEQLAMKAVSSIPQAMAR